MNDQDIELARVEAELQREETALATEVARLQTVSDELGRRAELLREQLAEADALGARDVALSDRLRRVVVSQPDPARNLERARQMRRAAVDARREANQAVRHVLTGWKDELTRMTSQVLADEPHAQRLLEQGRQSAEVARAEAAKAAERARAEAALAEQEREAAVSATLISAAPPLPGAPMSSPSGLHIQVGNIGGNGVRVGAKNPTGGLAIGQLKRPKGDPDGKAKRTSQRVAMQVSVDLHSDNNFFSGFSANISDGGLFIATVNLLPIGTEVDLTFTVPGSGQQITAHGVVRWVRELNDQTGQFPGLGVQFTRLGEDAEDAIVRFISEREPMFYVD